MAYSLALAERMRSALALQVPTTERKMFGGLAFLLNGHMCCGINGDDLMARVGPAAYEGLLANPAARPMDFTGKPLKGYLFVDGASLTDDALGEWVGHAVAFVRTLKPK